MLAKDKSGSYRMRVRPRRQITGRDRGGNRGYSRCDKRPAGYFHEISLPSPTG